MGKKKMKLQSKDPKCDVEANNEIVSLGSLFLSLETKM